MAGRTAGDEGSRHPAGFARALGRTIKVLRTDQGIERRDLAGRAGISYSYLTEIENGNRPPSPSVLAPIADALGVRMSRLIEAAEARMEVQSSELGLLPDGFAAVPETAPRQAAQVPRPAPAQAPLSGPRRDLRAAVLELERLLRVLDPGDIERVLDFARRLAR